MTVMIGIFEAKSNLSSLIAEAERGENIVITRHGKPVARLVSMADPLEERLAKRRKALGNLRAWQKEQKINIPHAEIREWINEGRR